MAGMSHGGIPSQTSGWQERRGWTLRLAAVLISQQPSCVLAVIEPGNIRLHQSFPAVSQSARCYLKTNKFEDNVFRRSSPGGTNHLDLSFYIRFLGILLSC